MQEKHGIIVMKVQLSPVLLHMLEDFNALNLLWLLLNFYVILFITEKKTTTTRNNFTKHKVNFHISMRVCAHACIG